MACESDRALKKAAAAQTKLDEAPIAMFEVDQDARIRYANQQACQSLGYSHEELCALYLYDIDPNVTPELWGTHARTVFGQRDRTFESLHRRKDSTVFPVEITVKYREVEGEIFSFAFVQDITERRRGKAVLRENEERLRLALEGSADGIWDWNLETGHVYFSPRYYTMLGYERGEFPASYESWRQLLHPGDAPAAEKAVRDALETHDPFAIEFRLRRKNGDWLWVLGRGKTVEVNVVGQAVRVAGSHTDISQLKRTEQALQESELVLRESEAQYRLLFDSNPQPMCVFDCETLAFLNVNEAAIEKYGYSREEFAQITIRDIRPREDIPFLLDYLAGLETGSDQGLARQPHARHQKKDGAVFDVEILSHPLTYQGHKARLVLIGDITERLRWEAALRESEAQYRLLFDSNPQPMWVLDCETLAFLNVNEAFCRTYGYSREEFSGLTLKDVRQHGDIPFLLDQPAPTNHGVHEISTRHKKKDGTVFDVEIISYPLIYQGRKARLALASDITQRLRSEAALRQLEQQLFQAQKMEAVGRLAGGVAHDFNNHLTVILGYCQMILGQLGPQDPMAAKIQQVLRAGEHSAHLTQQLLAFSRKQIMQPKTFCPNDVIADTVHMLDRVLGENIEIVTTLDPALGAIEADPGQLNQVLMNLAVNARDAMPNGGKITIQTVNVDLDGNYLERHNAVKPGAYVLITVSDNGTGMDKTTLDHIFEPFFTSKPAGEGTGLGLAMVYGIVQQSGGAIRVDSEPGQGTTFKIYFPRLDASVEMAPELASLVGAVGGDETILVVEDNEDVLFLTVCILERLGYHVLCASNGMEAVEKFGNHAGPIHLMVTDVMMPGMTGRDLAQRMARLRPAMKVLFTSGYTANVLAPQGILDPGVAYLPKPFTPNVLAKKVRRILSGEDSA